MQKVINVLALISFAVSAGVVGTGVYVVANKEAIKENIKEQITKGVKDSIGGALGGALTSGPADPVAGMDESGAVPIPAIPFGS
jgi:hypothetical protein